MIVAPTATIRFVICPTCRNVLPESPDVPVYECAVCGTCLQAKNQGNNATSTRPTLDEPDADQKSKSSHVTEDKESSSSIHGAILPCSMNCSSEQNNGGDCITSDDCSSDWHAAVNSSNEDQSKATDQNESGHLIAEQFRGPNSSNGDQKDLGDKNTSEDTCLAQLGWANSLNAAEQPDSTVVTSSQELSHLLNKELPLLTRSNSEADVDEESFQSARSDAGTDTEDDNSSCSGKLSTEKLVDTKDDSPIVTKCTTAEENISSDVLVESDCKFGRSVTEKVGDTKGSTSVATADRPAKESISLDILVKELDKPQKSVHHGFDRVRYADTSEANPSSNVSGALINLSKSPTTRSCCAYYDDGVSSCEEADYQLNARYKHSSKTACKPANHADYDDRPRRENCVVNSNSEVRHQLRNCSSIVTDKLHYTTKSGDQDKFLGPAKLCPPVSNWQGLERDGYPSKIPFDCRESLAGYESGSPSNQLLREFHCKPLYDLHDKHSNTEQKRMRLLRMVCKLQDQRAEASSHNENENGRVSGGGTWKDHHILKYHDLKFPEEDFFRNSNYHGHAGRFREGSNWPQNGKYLRPSFSTEAINCRCQVDNSLRSFPPDRQYSAQVPSTGLHYNFVPPGINFYNSNGSCPSNPQRLVKSEFPLYSRETNSDDQRHRHQDLKNYYREKLRLAKRHLRPMAGGAPFITCPHCLKQLQLPADFLFFERRCHRLRCGSCSELLKFSLLNRTHLVPYSPTIKTPPPSEIDACNDAIKKRNMSSSHASDCPHRDPSSFSDNYGVPFGKSCSTDRDPIFQSSSHALQSNEVDRHVSYDTYEHSEDRKKFVWSEPGNKYKNPVETDDSAGPSSVMSKPKNVSSEIEELPAQGS